MAQTKLTTFFNVLQLMVSLSFLVIIKASYVTYMYPKLDGKAK